MNRRRFIAGMSKGGLAVAAVSATTAAAVKGKEMLDKPADAVSGRLEALKKRVDALEDGQKKYLRALVVITAVSTGIDLSVLF